MGVRSSWSALPSLQSPHFLPLMIPTDDVVPFQSRRLADLFPLFLGRSPVGSDGETLSSDRACKSVLCPISSGLVVADGALAISFIPA
jgi:hypothetical protein